MKNQHGFALLLVLILLLFFSVMAIHMLSLYSNEYQFLELEHEQYRLDQLLLNGQLETIDMAKQDSLNRSGKLTYSEGEIHYVIETDLKVSKIILRVESFYKKQAVFFYDLDKDKMSGWEERNYWY